MTTVNYAMPVDGLQKCFSADAPLGSWSWFGAGGAAHWLFEPNNEDDLRLFFAKRPHDIKVTVVGAMSNVLIRDGGLCGIALRLGAGFCACDVDGEVLYAGGAMRLLKLAQVAMRHGCGGFEFLAGIPGTVGGAIRMNAGAFDGEVSQLVSKVILLDAHGVRHAWSNEECGFGYRASAIPHDWVVIGAYLEGRKKSKDAIQKTMAQLRMKRRTAQPVKLRTGGSTFKNPSGHNARKAWQLIEEAGCRDLRVGAATLAKTHCNFMVNEGTASAQDLEDLGRTVKKRVLAKTGVHLEWEIQRLGEAQ